MPIGGDQQCALESTISEVTVHHPTASPVCLLGASSTVVTIEPRVGPSVDKSSSVAHPLMEGNDIVIGLRFIIPKRTLLI